MEKYAPRHKMYELISANSSLLQVINRFGLSLGVGDKSIEEVCTENGIDCTTFLIIANFMNDGYVHLSDDMHEVSVPTLIHYLRQSHVYFLELSLPAIRAKLVSAISCSADEVSQLILKFFDDYMTAVRQHMEYEDETVFLYVEALLRGEEPGEYKIVTYSEHHEQVSESLTELKNILIKYCPKSVNSALMNDTLADIYNCEEGLEWHSKVEDYIFVPAIYHLERRQRHE
jgi:regulator of cell morphogenesis and NO signaling